MSQSKIHQSSQSPPHLTPSRKRTFETVSNFECISQSVLDISVAQTNLQEPELLNAGDDYAFVEDFDINLGDCNAASPSDVLCDLPDIAAPCTNTPVANVELEPNVCTQLATVNDSIEIRPCFVQDIPKEINIKGLRVLPHPRLATAAEGKEKSKSENNNNWSSKRADELRRSMGWDMSIAFGDLPLDQVDYLLSELFARVVKVDGTEYPAESLHNMLGGFKRILRHASSLRALKDKSEVPLGRDFCIKKHPQFVRTRLVVDAAIKKTAADGTNKKQKKVTHLTECQEVAILADFDHQASHNTGCQKRIVFYLLCRCGIRGGGELWNLKRFDLTIMTDREGKEFVRFVERHSKNNSHDINHTKEEQMRETYHSYEPDFVFSVKQYFRHMPDLVDGGNDALLLRPIASPAGIIWYNRAFRVSERISGDYLKNMLTLVGLPADSIVSNKSGRTTLITRMCAKGVPDHIGQLVTGHHTQNAYQRYDHTKELKMKAAIEATGNPGMNYTSALEKVSKDFVQESLIGSTEGLKPLIQGGNSEAFKPLLGRVSESTSSSSCMVLPPEVQVKEVGEPQVNLPKQVQDCAPNDTVMVDKLPKKLKAYHEHYDCIDWEVALQHMEPAIRKALGPKEGFPGQRPTVASGSSGSGSTFSGNFSGCTINIFPNFPPMVTENKENKPPERHHPAA